MLRWLCWLGMHDWRYAYKASYRFFRGCHRHDRWRRCQRCEALQSRFAAGRRGWSNWRTV